ncbi:TPA: Holliday junction branch migration DNA helicase RuvB [Vibrio vulnificus]|uniref:Holliday junction branch migration complex subunit RuvB n=1 Tax=Vibrio vulnificus TaxID=672 RepID=A0A8H9N3H7_VIBVL|nr:Holliday junction branch migration DNA helicase RuvB [Vibrio vulnificus]
MQYITTEKLKVSTENLKSLRPSSFEEYIGQEKIIRQLKVAVSAAKMRQEAGVEGDGLKHILVDGQPGLGKTSLAFVIANEFGSKVHVMQANSLEKLGDLAAVLVTLGENDILFIDEIHALRPQIEEMLYSAMEDFRFDIIADAGDGSGRPINMELPFFTLVGATTILGRISEPAQQRFQNKFTLDPYSIDELCAIIKLNEVKLGVKVSDEAAEFIANASRGTPRICNALLTKCRDYAQVDGSKILDLKHCEEAFKDASINDDGQSKNDAVYLMKLYQHIHINGNKYAGLKVLTEITNIPERTIESTIEPFLMRNNLISKTPRGRVLTDEGTLKAKNYLADKPDTITN